MDNFKDKIRNSKSAIEQSKKDNPNQIYQISKSKVVKSKKKINLSLGMNFVLATTLIIVITIFSIGLLNNPVVPTVDENAGSGITSGGGNQTPPGSNGSDSQNVFGDFVRVSTLEELKNLLSESGSASDDWDEDLEVGIPTQPGLDGGDSPIYGVTGDMPSVEPNFKEDVYQTNGQVKGVDEADIVKVNGKYIYYISIKSNTLHIIKTNDAQMTEVKRYSFESTNELLIENEEASAFKISNTTILDLYYTDLYLIVRTQTNTFTKVTTKNSSSFYTSDSRNFSEFHIYDINSYELVKKVQTAGMNVDTRLVGNELIIVNNYLDYKNDTNLIIPTYYVNELVVVPTIDRVYYCPYFGNNINSYVVIYKVILNNDIEIKDFYFLSPYIANLYASNNKIYLIRNTSNIKEVKGNIESTYNGTRILVFDYQEDIKPVDVIEVKGKISDKYWMDEYNGFLRIATTGSKTVRKLLGGKYPYQTSWDIFNYLTIYKQNSDGKYEEISSITEGLGEPGETMYSARFNENKATIVTFKQTDPLYYIDLTDHYHPIITSELKITGFTVYQHPYKENYIIGFGYEADENGRNIGYKVALFDVKDKNNIKQVGKPHVFLYASHDAAILSGMHAYIADYYYDFEVLSNPKALLSNMKKGLFGFSINGRKYVGSAYESSYEHTNRYMVIKIDLESDDPLKVILNETHKEYKYNNYYERMVFVGEYYYLLSSEKLIAYKLDNKLNKVSELVF